MSKHSVCAMLFKAGVRFGFKVTHVLQAATVPRLRADTKAPGTYMSQVLWCQYVITYCRASERGP